jgi:hypothetical protein
MKWEEQIQRLAARARTEQPPQVDVTHSVLAMLSTGQAEPIAVTERFWMWLAAASAAVAVPAAVVAVTLYNASTGPLREIVNSIAWAM